MQFKEAIYKQYITYHNAHLYGRPTLQKFVAHFPINDHFLGRFLPVDKGSSILDIGCGDGNLVYWLQQKGYLKTKGVDISVEQIETGRALGIPGLEVADLTTFLERQSGLDLVLARDVFEHFTRQDFFEALVQIKKALSPQGVLVVQLPNGEGLHHTSILYGDITHEMAYTESSLRQLVLAAGFESVAVSAVNPYSPGLKGVLRRGLWNIRTAHHRFWKWIETGNSSGIFTSNLIAYIK